MSMPEPCCDEDMTCLECNPDATFQDIYDRCPTCIHAEGYDRLSGPCPTCRGEGEIQSFRPDSGDA